MIKWAEVQVFHRMSCKSNIHGIKNLINHIIKNLINHIGKTKIDLRYDLLEKNNDSRSIKFKMNV